MGILKAFLVVILVMGSFNFQAVVATAKEVSAAGATNNGEVVAAEEVSQPVSAYFPDPNLAAEIAEELDDEGIVNDCTVDTFVTPSQLGLIDSLYSYNADISSLEGLQYLTGAHALTIPGGSVSDLTPLAGLTNLTFLDLGDHQIYDLTPLANLTNLTHLHLEYNQISDLTPLSGLTNLEQLDLSYNQISDISTLANFTNLNFLNLMVNQISDLTPLSGLVHLDHLYLNNNPISNVQPLSNLVNLEYLYLSACQITDISPLQAVLSDMTFYNVDFQEVTLPPVTLGTPTSVNFENLDGSTPEITFTVGQGIYDEGTEQLTWSTVGDNQLTWTATIPGTTNKFSGTLNQTVLPN